MTACGGTISVSKTRLLVAGCGVVQNNLDLIVVSNVSVTTFCHLGSLVESHGGVHMELNTRISRAASVSGAFRRFVFSEYMLSITTKSIYG